MKPCAAPIAFEALVVLWAGEIDDSEASRIDEHLFGCESCARRSDRLGSLVGGLREVIPAVVSRAHRDRLLERGVRIVETRVTPGTHAHARFGPDVDLLVHVLEGDLSKAKRVDVDVVGSDGSTLFAFAGVPFDAARGEILIACQRHYRGMLENDQDPIFRVRAIEGGEHPRSVDYVVVHEWS